MPAIPFDLLEGPYVRDIIDQPRAVAATVESLEPAKELHTIREQLERGDKRRVVLTGMGGSYQVLWPLHIRLTQAGLASIMVETSELIHSMPRLLDPSSVIVAVSQSGESAEILRLLERRTTGIIGVTNTEGSTLATRAEFALLTRAGKEDAVSFKTALTALAMLHWIGEHLCAGDLAAARADLEPVSAGIAAYVSRWKEHVGDLYPLLDGVQSFLAAGRGQSLAAAGLGGMIQKEVAKVHGEALSSAALRHGPFEMLSANVFALVFEGAPDVQSMNRRLVEDIQAAGGRAALCGRNVEPGPFELPPAPDPVMPMLELLPPQMVSLAFAALRQRRPGQFQLITKVTTVE